VAELSACLSELSEAVADLSARQEEVVVARRLAEDGLARADYSLQVANDMSLPTRMLAFMAWLDLHPPQGDGPAISVVLATRDRPQLLRRAIASVIGQRYGNWELLVVDDGSDPGTRAAVEEFEDERMCLLEGPQSGLSAARNRGLDSAGGEIICYLDDDNVMHPAWLHAVAKVFSEREDVDVGYGITLSEHRIPGDLGERGWWPSFWQLPWSREELLRENVTDAGALAHRRGLTEARFDEELGSGEDWDLLLRLTRDRDALRMPVLSHAYAMHVADRMSAQEDHRRVLDEIRRRHADG
jgi:glycosyltransferase involved in cell wall biosynthesis